MKNKNVKPIKGLIMKVNVSRKTKAVADEEKIAIGVLEEGVVHLYYYQYPYLPSPKIYLQLHIHKYLNLQLNSQIMKHYQFFE